MKRAFWIGVLAVLAFSVFLLIRLPASWLAGVLPRDIACGQLSGTAWNGVCGALSWKSMPFGDLNWRLQPLALLNGTLDSQVALQGPMGVAAAQLVARRDGTLTLRNLQGSFTLDPAVLTALPPNLRGTLHTNLALLRIENGMIAAIEGRVDVRNLEQRDRQTLQLGDYAATFPAGAKGEPVGEVRSIGGPLDIRGRLRLTREPGFALDGTVKAGSRASPGLVQQLRGLGMPDAQGRRPFSVAGTF